MKTLYPTTIESVSRGLSPRLWGGMPLDQIFGGPNKLDVGVGIFDDFDCFDSSLDSAATVRVGSGGQRIYIDTGCTVSQVGVGAALTGANGVLNLYADGTANDNIWIQWGGITGGLFNISTTAAYRRDLAFECRAKLSVVTANVPSIFIGLEEEARAVTGNKTAGTGVMVAKDYLGFNSVQGATAVQAALNFVYNISAGTEQSVIAAAHTIVADTWFKVGFRYDASVPNITAYVNGVEGATKVTAANIAATTVFPTAQAMMPIIGMDIGSGAATATLSIDWMCCAQVEAVG